MRNYISLISAIIACSVIGTSVFTPSDASAQTDTLRVPGVAAPTEIVRDGWGVPHIYAGSTRDLFFRLSQPDTSIRP
ncbi:MAG TPA: penicillin acylase family protein [Longimicrobiaceae bacterium]|nr:penicillin acylase family protein [Longimicrobiaceae bacterium]